MSSTEMPWSKNTELRFRDFDYLGHMTATSYLALLEEARVDWLAQATADQHPSYVVATQELTFLAEILPSDGPVRITITPELLTDHRYLVHEQIIGSGGTLHATSRALLVAWDREHRRPRVLTQTERDLLSGPSPTRAEHFRRDNMTGNENPQS